MGMAVLSAAHAWGQPQKDRHEDRIMQLRVMTWNVRYHNPRDGENAWPHRKDWIAQIIRREAPDVLGCQEVLADQLDDLKQRLPDYAVYGVGRDDGEQRGEFAPIFYDAERLELVEKSTFWLSPTPDEPGSTGWDARLPRIASWVRLRDKKTKTQFYAMNTHFDHRGDQARAESAALLLRKLREAFREHAVVLTGDFNATPASRPYNTLVGAIDRNKNQQGRAFRDARVHAAETPTGPDSTWNGFESIVPKHRIDYIFATDEVRVRSVRILDEQRDGKFPSDHLPVVAELTLPAGE